MDQKIKLGIIGDFDSNLPSHKATEEALAHAAGLLSRSTETSWISTESLAVGNVVGMLDVFHGLLSASGDYRNINGALKAIRFAREHGKPFIGT